MTRTETIVGSDGRLYLVLRKANDNPAYQGDNPINYEEQECSRVIIIDPDDFNIRENVVEFYLK